MLYSFFSLLFLSVRLSLFLFGEGDWELLVSHLCFEGFFLCAVCFVKVLVCVIIIIMIMIMIIVNGLFR